MSGRSRRSQQLEEVVRWILFSVPEIQLGREIAKLCFLPSGPNNFTQYNLT
jgi:hypothetical protein